MSTFIQREVAKISIDKDEYYVCMFVHEQILVNLSFFKKEGDKQYKEMLRHHLSQEIAQELIRRVRENEVMKVTPSELKEFEIALNQINYAIGTEIKTFIHKTNKDIVIDYIGEIAGFHYIVTKANDVPFKEMYYLQETKTGDGFEVGKIPPRFMEMVVLDYVHHAKIDKKPTYLAIDKKEVIGLKKTHKTASIVHVVNINVSNEHVSASKAYMISKINPYEYKLLSIEDSTSELMEGLKKEAQNMIHELIEELDMEIL